MELSLQPASVNRFEVNGILIKGSSVRHWLLEVQRMNLNLRSVRLYPVPGVTANSVWGCLVVPCAIDKSVIGKNERCQQVTQHFYIAEYSSYSPELTKSELENLFGNSLWLMHPEIGLANLTESLDLKEYIALPTESNIYVHRPFPSTFIPSEIRSFQIAPVDLEEALRKLEKEAFPERKKMKDEPLNFWEKMKLSYYRMQYKSGKSDSSTESEPGIRIGEQSGFGRMMDKISGRLFKGNAARRERMEKDFEDLERRNQKQIDKLLDMLRNNPQEALKFAIPLDENGSSRGPGKGALDLSKRWSLFDLFGSQSGRTGGGAVDIGEHYHRLNQQYHKTAEDLIAQKEYTKAAFIYIKLLKNSFLAAETLEKGHLYQDAATVYLKYVKNKQKAAECYEKGNLISNAMELYKELEMHEKVGDLYVSLNQKNEARPYYEKVAGKFKSEGRFIQAHAIYRDKIQDDHTAIETLMDGWRLSREKVDCLKLYLSRIHDPQELKKEIIRLRTEEVHPTNGYEFLQVLKDDHCQHPELTDYIKQTAYEIVAEHIEHNPDIIKELKHFSPENKGLAKDAMRFSVMRNKQRNLPGRKNT